MTIEERLEVLRAMSDETDEVILRAYLNLAGQKVIEKAFPFRQDVKDVPDKYIFNQIEIAVYLLDKQGAGGQTSHSENGISRRYESASVPNSMLKGIIPFGKVVS